MKFLRRPLRPDECMINLRRLSCPAVAFLYILDRYAETRQWDMDDTLLRGTFSGFCSDDASSSRSVSKHANWPRQAKNRAENLDFGNISLHLPKVNPPRRQ